MRVLSLGIIPVSVSVIHTCAKCNTVFEVDEKDCQSRTFRNETQLEFPCPLCKETILFYHENFVSTPAKPTDSTGLPRSTYNKYGSARYDS